jgi:hypothetical protein
VAAALLWDVSAFAYLPALLAAGFFTGMLTAAAAVPFFARFGAALPSGRVAGK